MQLCAIASCDNSITISENTSLHSFPLGNTSLLKKWVYNMKLSERNPPLSYFLCDKHFLSSCFNEGKLAQDAIPSIEPAEDNSIIIDTVPKYDMNGKKSIVEESIGAFLCRICSCSLEIDNMISIFDDKKKVFQKINSCLPILVEHCNDLPHHICDKCCKQLERMYLIRSLAASSESLFNHHLSTFSTKEGDESDEKMVIETEKDKFWVIEDQLPLKGPITCNLCDEEFNDMDKFDIHMEQHGIEFCEDPPSDMLHIACSSCGLVFEAESAYNDHKRNQKYECATCEIILQSYCEVKSHDCSKYLQEANNLPQIMALTDGGTLEEYDENFENDEKQYRKSHTKKRKYHCSPCNRQFQRHVNWLKHKMKHEKDEFFECKECDLQFDKLRLLNQHKEKHHKNNQNWICRFCGKHTTTKLSLNIHERIHTGVKPFICEWCGNAFRSKANLSQHHAKHTGIRRHSCSVCGKKFSRKSFVTTHMRVHTGERPYACDICEQRFTQVGDMRRHRRRHIVQQQQQLELQQQQSQNHFQDVIIHHVLLKEEKNDTETDLADNNVINNASSNTVAQIGSKISIADIRAHFL